MTKARSLRNLWACVPPSVKNCCAEIVHVLPPRVYLGRRFRTAFAFARRAQWWTRDRAEQYQIGCLRRIMALAYDRAPYYRQVFKSLGFDPGDFRALEEIRELPTIDKQVLHRHLDRMCVRSPHASDVDYVSTGGTSGTPFCFYAPSGRSAVEYGYLTATWERVGYDSNIPMVVLRGRLVAKNARGIHHEYDPLLRHHYYSTFHMTDDQMSRYVEHMRTVGPCFLHAYPSSATTLAGFIRRENIRPPLNIRGIITESENIYPDQRKTIEDVFNARMFSSYGHSEKLVLAAECEHSTDYHVWPTYGFCELLDERGQQVTTPGQRGEIVGTGWINDVVPFIRYRTGDYAVHAGWGCGACGRQHMLLRQVEGRWPAGDLVAVDGALISMTAVNVHDDTFARIRQFQFYQDTPGVALLRVVPAPGFNDDDRGRILASLARRLSGRVEIGLSVVESIALTQRGKAVYVDQHIKSTSSSRDGSLHRSTPGETAKGDA